MYTEQSLVSVDREKGVVWSGIRDVWDKGLENTWDGGHLNLCHVERRPEESQG